MLAKHCAQKRCRKKPSTTCGMIFCVRNPVAVHTAHQGEAGGNRLLLFIVRKPRPVIEQEGGSANRLRPWWRNLRSMKLKEAEPPTWKATVLQELRIPTDDSPSRTLAVGSAPAMSMQRLNRQIRSVRTRPAGQSPGTARPPSCWSVPGCAMWPAPSGATEKVRVNMKHLEARP